MCCQITLASLKDEDALQVLFKASGMDVVGDIDEHVIIKTDHEVRGAGMLAQLDQNEFHLLTFAVKPEERSKGYGSRLIKEILHGPWDCCREWAGTAEERYKVTTVARGQRVGFYKRNGFAECDFSELAYPFCEQCDHCADKSSCNPAAMVYIGYRQHLGLSEQPLK